MNIGVIIQARMGSTRLPGKILLPFYDDKTILEIILEKLHKIEEVNVIVVATSDSKSNDVLEQYLVKRNELVFRGSENDVLNRFIKAAEKYNVNGIIRICSDNPFLDLTGLQHLVQFARKSDADYIGFKINNTPSIKTHFGFWGEYVTLNALKKVESSTDINTPAHEHVTIHIYSHPEEYKCEWIKCPDILHGRDDIRLTVDTPEDFINAQQVYKYFANHNPNFGLDDIVDYVDSHSEIKMTMSEIMSNNKK